MPTLFELLGIKPTLDCDKINSYIRKLTNEQERRHVLQTLIHLPRHDAESSVIHGDFLLQDTSIRSYIELIAHKILGIDEQILSDEEGMPLSPDMIMSRILLAFQLKDAELGTLLPGRSGLPVGGEWGALHHALCFLESNKENIRDVLRSLFNNAETALPDSPLPGTSSSSTASTPVRNRNSFFDELVRSTKEQYKEIKHFFNP